MAEMDTSENTTVSLPDPIQLCRQECASGNFLQAINSLRAALDGSPTGTGARLVSELVRVLIITGDRTSAESELNARTNSLPEVHQATSYDDAISLQRAILAVSARGELEEAIKLANQLWSKYAFDSTLVLDAEGGWDADNAPILIAYYAVEVFDLHRRYGQGISATSFSPTTELLQSIITRLLQSSLVFEALEIMEYFVDDPVPLFYSLATAFLTDGNPGAEDVILRCAKVQLENGELESGKLVLESLDKLHIRGATVLERREVLELRYLSTEPDRITATQRLLQLAETFENAKLFDAAMETLEYAAELHCKLGITEETVRLGFQSHDTLRLLISRSGDLLSGVQIELRLCDMISSTTGDLVEARTRRDQLLSLPICAKLPYFGKFHKRQSLEYLMVHLREPALHHAEKYREYCTILQDEGELSLANNLRLSALFQPGRTSEEARIACLESLREELEQGIEEDRTAKRHLAHVEKALLLAEVMEELARLEGEEREDAWPVIAELLDDAESICGLIRPAADAILPSLQVGYLKGIFEEPNFDRGSRMTSESEPAADDDPSHHLRHAFNGIKLVSRLCRAVQTLSAPVLVAAMNDLHAEEERVLSEGHPLEMIEFLTCQGTAYYVLLSFTDSKLLTTEDLPFTTPHEGLALILDCFERAIELEEEMASQLSDSPESLLTLKAVQSFRSGPLKSSLLELAVSICFDLDDNSLLWKWVQMTKAQAYSSLLRKRLDNPVSVSAVPSFEDMLWASSATSRQLVFVDWVSVNRDPEPRLLLVLALQFKRDEEGPLRKLTVAVVDMSVDEVEERISSLTPARLDGSDWQRALAGFAPLVEPLREVCGEEDILVLSPTGPLHKLPLHALTVDGSTLIERNTCIYTPSMSVLVSCLRRLENPTPGVERRQDWSAAVLAAYDDDSPSDSSAAERKDIYRSVTTIAAILGSSLVLGPELSASRFAQEAESSNLVHFHGHASRDPHDPLDQNLLLGATGERITLEAAASLVLREAPHLNLIACSSGVQDISADGLDEPLGLVTAFLMSGAASVTGALWPIQSATGRSFSQIFFEEYIRLNNGPPRDLGPVVNLADIVRQAAVRLMKDAKTSTPYHWAAFVLYGAWFSVRK
ncbi:CHAT domain-containing protein [Cladorrhinum samala]|uniref:CHAT domain-containing protein n=1 Tax=Cladorrhinum samala TaxID=585594 RepID=A0AAV9HBZ2_9PEZI|nr:CHAT domain-containing protein [Cladorrhinum samala]